MSIENLTQAQQSLLNQADPYLAADALFYHALSLFSDSRLIADLDELEIHVTEWLKPFLFSYIQSEYTSAESLVVTCASYFSDRGWICVDRSLGRVRLVPEAQVEMDRVFQGNSWMAQFVRLVTSTYYDTRARQYLVDQQAFCVDLH